MQKPNMLALNTLHTHTDKVRERNTRTDHHDTLALAPSLVHTCVSIWHWLYSLCSLSRWSWFRLMSMCAFYVVTFTRNQKNRESRMSFGYQQRRTCHVAIAVSVSVFESREREIESERASTLAHRVSHAYVYVWSFFEHMKSHQRTTATERARESDSTLKFWVYGAVYGFFSSSARNKSVCDM